MGGVVWGRWMVLALTWLYLNFSTHWRLIQQKFAAASHCNRVHGPHTEHSAASVLVPFCRDFFSCRPPCSCRNLR